VQRQQSVHLIKLRSFWLPLFIVIVLLFQPLYANLNDGQIYILVLALLVLTWHGYRTGRDGLLGVSLGLLLIFKLAAVLLWPLLVVQRRWRAIVWGAGAALVVALLSFPRMGLAAWERHVQVVFESLAAPARAVSAYQTLTGFVRHMFTYDARFSPEPLVLAPGLGVFLARFSFLLLLGIGVFWAHRYGPSDMMFASFAIISVVLSSH
jgi:hypothetical protein